MEERINILIVRCFSEDEDMRAPRTPKVLRHQTPRSFIILHANVKRVVSEKLEQGVIEIDYVESEKNLADPLAKPKSYEVLLKLGLEGVPRV
jgi:hypothetical protein